ncbi:DUF86 domain-containing protein [Leptospira mtsangambouensis]|uniref:HepT-like ribonuclease domain-containing protein n=1 Tax=Leptospira mtsangambouensis TaxID=2484912 RepID=UPI001EEA29E9|nr:HepT-like ribonuclease domain-containing protein [Leptospira mtsangambouensis]MCG6142703.1 DUF86 domain-containing protein [Leptospira mtsangambouensis]
MLKNRKNDLLYLLNIIEYIEKISLYSNSFENPETLYETNDQMNYNAILSLLTQIGENSNKLSDETKNEYPYPWKDVVGLRNRIAHDYTGINIFIVFQTIKYSLPSLKEKAYQIIKDGISENIFDKSELLSTKESNYYSHIDFKKLEFEQ